MWLNLLLRISIYLPLSAKKSSLYLKLNKKDNLTLVTTNL